MTYVLIYNIKHCGIEVTELDADTEEDLMKQVKEELKTYSEDELCHIALYCIAEDVPTKYTYEIKPLLK